MKQKSIILILVVFLAILGSMAFAMTLFSNEAEDPLESNNITLNNNNNNITLNNSTNRTTSTVSDSKVSTSSSKDSSRIEGNKDCPNCSSGKVICKSCRGSGGFWDDDHNWLRCSDCGGTGGYPCKVCDGKGYL